VRYYTQQLERRDATRKRTEKERKRHITYEPARQLASPPEFNARPIRHHQTAENPTGAVVEKLIIDILVKDWRTFRQALDDSP